jgi:hypothetical protein
MGALKVNSFVAGNLLFQTHTVCIPDAMADIPPIKAPGKPGMMRKP